MLWDPFLYCINDSIQGKSETGNKVFVLTYKVSINILFLSPSGISQIIDDTTYCSTKCIIGQIRYLKCSKME